MNVLDLFSGIGGFSLGLERAGMRTVAFCEIDPYCRAVLAKHWPAVPIFGDVRTITAETLADAGIVRRNRRASPAGCKARAGTRLEGVDLICGGFPCQDISTAGKGAGIAGARSGLWSEYARIIGELRPRYVIVENVAALLGRGIERVLGDLATLGYDAEWHCIPAAAVGAPHRRDRVWIVAHAERGGLQGALWAELCGISGGQHQPAGGSGHWLVEPDVRGISDGLSARLHGGLNAGQGMGAESYPSAIAETELRNVWRQFTSRPAPQGQGPDEQLARELADALPSLPHALALGGGQDALAAASRFLHRMRQACEAVGALRDASQPTATAWQSLSDQEAGRAFTAACGRADWRSGEWLGVGRVAHKVPARVDRLRALGNAVVPQIPEIIGRAIMSAAR